MAIIPNKNPAPPPSTGILPAEQPYVTGSELPPSGRSAWLGSPPHESSSRSSAPSPSLSTPAARMLSRALVSDAVSSARSPLATIDLPKSELAGPTGSAAAAWQRSHEGALASTSAVFIASG